MITNAQIEHNLGKAYYLRSASPRNLEAPVSKSLLWDFNESPYKWRHSSGREATRAMDLGTLIHAAILEPEMPIANIASVSPYADFRTKAAQEWKADQREMGKMIATDEDIRAASGCEQVFSEDYKYRFGGGYKTEVAVFATIGATQIKGMIDLVPDNLDLLVDLKTTARIGSLREITNTIISRGYHWQAALYLDLWNAASGEKRTRFVICFIEVSEPYESAWVEVSPQLIEAGRAGYMNALAKWQSCVAIDIWPRQHEGITLIEKPAYL
jgi:exodeoxyribonuclease VIII